MHRLRNLIVLLTLFAAIGLLPGNVRASERGNIAGIAAIVNQDAISMADVTARMSMIMASSGMKGSLEVRERLIPQILSTLIDEQIMIQEASRLGIAVGTAEIKDGFRMIASQNKLSDQQFRDVLKKDGIPVRTLNDQIKAQLLWSRVIQVRLRPEVTVTDNEVDAQYERMVANIGKMEYLVSEIFLPVETSYNEQNTKSLADRLVRQMVGGGASFPRVAKQFSKSSGAARGGDLGWVQEGQLQDKIHARLMDMGEGDLSSPIRTLAGYHILLLRKKREITTESLPSKEEIENKLGLERLDRLQRSYLLDLKAAAFIEYRV